MSLLLWKLWYGGKGWGGGDVAMLYEGRRSWGCGADKEEYESIHVRWMPGCSFKVNQYKICKMTGGHQSAVCCGSWPKTHGSHERSTRLSPPACRYLTITTACRYITITTACHYITIITHTVTRLKMFNYGQYSTRSHTQNGKVQWLCSDMNGDP